MTEITLRANGHAHRVAVDTRATLLDVLRDQLGDPSPKKGCDHGQCGSCTVLVRGRRVLSCLTLAVTCDAADVTTAAGTPSDAVRQAFLDHDAFQCGYCTPGQICSAAGMLAEFADGWPSHVTPDVSARPELTDAELAERMSGNLCRCGAYPAIVSALRQAAGDLR